MHTEPWGASAATHNALRATHIQRRTLDTGVLPHAHTCMCVCVSRACGTWPSECRHTQCMSWQLRSLGSTSHPRLKSASANRISPHP
eukprot:734955-Rhodomonas_salina.2